MRSNLILTLAVASLAGLALTGCSAQSASSSSPAATHTSAAGQSDAYGSSSGSAAPSSGATGATVKTASSSLGTVVVTGAGRTAYYFDADTANSGKSTCTGQCAAAWPAVESTSTTPTVDGVTGKVSTITGVDGKPQVTIDGRPIYTFAGDEKPGDTAGQGVKGVWYVVNPDGTEHKG
ncbi:hypothetical protein [Curtobacterium sp. L1-20]|uniref:COG4315 family predicted lipoprotein n=1 Tax=Curtobacterium sp. L1-20 TaxID=3138181 RepID=UPI003B52C515